MNTVADNAKVILAGAGPGDPDLITVKAAMHLREAEVVLVDRLVSSEIIRRYVNPAARVIEVGKQCRRGVSTPQQTINELILRYARQGKKLVRLKGGDVSFFSNILDELQVLLRNNIPYEIVPGVTAASGAAAYAGIPLTARDHATSVRFLTSYKPSAITDNYWRELSATDDTLVFYMSSETIDALVDKLVMHGIAADRQLAVVEQATTPLQQVYAAPVHSFREKFGGRSFLSPSLIIVGKVVALHASFQWFSGKDLGDHYFKPLTAPVESLPEITKKNYADRA
ncbi:MAG: uroporphyrinogen-III C-methyltransferase [Chitinophagaceae bacterium]|nr:uroporphyrinogen-III C-methyltransferase [Chitinophagaceae bacterium]